MRTELLGAIHELHVDVLNLREEVRVGFASLPSSYVSREEMGDARREAGAAKRWAIGVGLASFLSFGGILLNFIL